MIVGYTFRKHVLRLRSRVAVKLNFRSYIRRMKILKSSWSGSCPSRIVTSGQLPDLSVAFYKINSLRSQLKTERIYVFKIVN